jgi:mannose-6-phosphate isomerase-like protein (cupin superfamily)
MSRRPGERVTALDAVALERVRAHGGRGRIQMRRLFRRGTFVAPVNFVDYAVLAPGTSIGLHRHRRDNEEIYLVLSGRGRMHLDGREFAVGPGSVVVNRPGGRHGLENTGRAALRLFVVEVALAQRAPRRAT